MSRIEDRHEARTEAPPPGGERGGLTLGAWMLVGMGVGMLAGAVLGERAAALEFLGDIFVRLLILGAVPLLFCNLVASLATAGGEEGIGRLLVRIGTFFLLTTATAHVISLAVVAAMRPGAGLEAGPGDAAAGASGAAAMSSAADAPSPGDWFTSLVPDNLFGVFVDTRIAAVVVLAILIGLAARSLDEERRERVSRAFDAGVAVFRRLVRTVLWAGPVGVGALAAAAVGIHGRQIFGPLGTYLGGMWIANLAMFVLYLVLLRVLSPMRPLDFLRRTSTVWTTTFSTCSSHASLGASLNAAERIRLRRSTYALTLPLGAQLNKAGSSVLLSGVFLFTVQASGAEFSFWQLAAAVGLGTLLSAGAPGVPGGGIVNQILLLQTFGLPLDYVLLVAGVYRLIDMPTTTVNIMGDLIGTVIVDPPPSAGPAEGTAAARA